MLKCIGIICVSVLTSIILFGPKIAYVYGIVTEPNPVGSSQGTNSQGTRASKT
jgi:hypothetical protein